MSERIDVLGTLFDDLTKQEAVDAAFELMEKEKAAYAVTPNPEIVMICRRDSQAQSAVNDAELVVADGVGIVIGARMLGTPLREKIPGFELSCALMERMAGTGKSVYLLGAKPGVAEKAAENIAQRWPGLRIAGTHDGYFRDDGPVIEAINACRPDLILVCLGAPKQEKWMRQNRDRLDAGFMIGNGGALDVLAGNVQRAPQKICDMGLEWAYRLYKEPWRARRMMEIPKFLLCVVGKKLKGKK